MYDKSVEENNIINQTKKPDVDTYSSGYTSVDENGLPKNFLFFGGYKPPRGTEAEIMPHIIEDVNEYSRLFVV